MKAQTVAALLLAVTLLAVPASQAMAQTGMSVDVTTTDGRDIVISGTTTKTDHPVAVQITTQQGNVIFVDQDSPGADGTYEFVTRTGGILGWNEDGIYVVNVNQSQGASSSPYNLSVNILVDNGMVSDTSTASMSSIVGLDDDLPERMETPDPGLEFTADAQPGASVIRIEGMTTSMANDVTIIVEAPNGNKVHTGQITPSRDGSFADDIMLGCPQWEQDGDYVISVQQGSNAVFSQSAEVEISECLVVPEFGAVAMAILAVAIVATIAITARSRLGLITRI